MSTIIIDLSTRLSYLCQSITAWLPQLLCGSLVFSCSDRDIVAYPVLSSSSDCELFDHSAGVESSSCPIVWSHLCSASYTLCCHCRRTRQYYSSVALKKCGRLLPQYTVQTTAIGDECWNLISVIVLFCCRWHTLLQCVPLFCRKLVASTGLVVLRVNLWWNDCQVVRSRLISRPSFHKNGGLTREQILEELNSIQSINNNRTVRSYSYISIRTNQINSSFKY